MIILVCAFSGLALAALYNIGDALNKIAKQLAIKNSLDARIAGLPDPNKKLN